MDRAFGVYDLSTVRDMSATNQLPPRAAISEQGGVGRVLLSILSDFGIQVTSTSESAHARLKKNLSLGSRSYLFDLLKDSSELLLAHVNEIQGEIAKEMSHVPTETMSPRFAILQRRISHIALRKVKKQYDLAISPDYTDDCSNAFTAKFGIPCKHWLHQIINRQRVLDGDLQAVFQVPIDFIDQH